MMFLTHLAAHSRHIKQAYWLFFALIALWLAFVYVKQNNLLPPQWFHQSITDRFTDNRDGTLTDKQNHVQWTRCYVGSWWTKETNECIFYPGAYTSEDLGKIKVFIAGFDDWRIPTQDELLSILTCRQTNDCVKDPSLQVDSRLFTIIEYPDLDDLHIFPNKVWVSSNANAQEYLLVDMLTGQIEPSVDATHQHSVFMVRDLDKQ